MRAGEPFGRESRLKQAMPWFQNKSFSCLLFSCDPSATRRAGVLILMVAAAAVSASAQNRSDQKKPIPLRPIAPLDLPATLDMYASGRFDEAVRTIARAGDEVGRNLRRHWAVTGAAWIDRDAGDRPRRLLAAAALALESETLRAERGEWRVSDNPTCAAACVLDWAQQRLIERGGADAAERAWYLAAAALAGGVRDARYLHRPIDLERSARVLPGLMDRAVLRFPDDPALRLERAIAAAARFTTLTDTGTARPALAERELSARAVPERFRTRDASANDAAVMLEALAGDPLVGPEARVRLGFLEWALGNDQASRTALTIASAQATDPDVRFLAQFLIGWTGLARGDGAAAADALDAALTTRPGSQSAAVLRAALALQDGDATTADAAGAQALGRRGDLDPWRLFLYGHHHRLPAVIASLRAEVAK